MIMHILIICLGLFLLKFIWQPWRKHQWYTQNFENQGYRVMEVPFKPLGLAPMKYYDFSDKAKDSYAAVKKEYPHHDVVVFNALNNIFIDVINPDLQQELTSLESLSSFPKGPLEREGFGKVLGNGLLISEGKTWKGKRKVLT